MKRIGLSLLLALTGTGSALAEHASTATKRAAAAAVPKLTISRWFVDTERAESWRTLLDACDDATKDGNWAAPVAGLQSILDSKSWLAVAPNGAGCIDYRAEALRKLRSAPKLLEAYRTKYERAAEIAYEASLEVGEKNVLLGLERLRAVASRYRYTETGLRALNQLATYFLDRGHRLAAASLFDAVVDELPLVSPAALAKRGMSAASIRQLADLALGKLGLDGTKQPAAAFSTQEHLDMLALNPAFAKRASPLLEPLATALLEEGYDSDVRNFALVPECFPLDAAVMAKAKQSGDALALARGQKALSSEKTEERVEAIGLLAKVGKSAVPALVKALSDRKGAARMAAVRALGDIGPAAHVAVDALLALALDGPEADMPSVIAALARIAPEEAARKLGKSTGHERWRDRAFLALRALGPPAAVAPLQEALSGTANERWNAAKTLVTFGPRAHAAVPALMKMFREGDYMMRDAAADALRAIGPKALPAVPLLLAAADGHGLVAVQSLRALDAIGPGIASAVKRWIAEAPAEEKRLETEAAAMRAKHELARATLASSVKAAFLTYCPGAYHKHYGIATWEAPLRDQYAAALAEAMLRPDFAHAKFRSLLAEAVSAEPKHETFLKNPLHVGKKSQGDGNAYQVAVEKHWRELQDTLATLPPEAGGARGFLDRVLNGGTGQIALVRIDGKALLDVWRHLEEHGPALRASAAEASAAADRLSEHRRTVTDIERLWNQVRMRHWGA